MTEDNTKDLTTDEKLDSILSKLANVETRLSALEAVAEDRARETRPKLDLIIKEISDANERLTAVEKELRSINRQFETFAIDHMKMRADIRGIDARVIELERKPM